MRGRLLSRQQLFALIPLINWLEIAHHRFRQWLWGSQSSGGRTGRQFGLFSFGLPRWRPVREWLVDWDCLLDDNSSCHFGVQPAVVRKLTRILECALELLIGIEHRRGESVIILIHCVWNVIVVRP